ncbi:hypothetical protein QTG54_012364 [Skeletonema marinoi]|uniref:Ferric reductase NAD binding domain-containing protein n=1 Tax=Skeletonema marinoi TaxID=267567 RepID=A0AAD9D8P2_9STRA|nr:hypothetical protein QTG54_012364 [Skeletonema marinoi]
MTSSVCMVEMTIFLCILLPISVRWFASKWHAGIHLHRLVNLVYFVDIVRRHSHPHSWILNTPVFALYLFDKHVFTYFYKRNKSPAMKRIRLGQDFMVLYWDSPYGFTDTVGPDYSMLMNNSSLLEQKHVFTCFENRSGRELEDTNEEEDGTDTYENESSGDGHKWTVGVVIRVFRRPRSPVLGARDRVSHTQRMYDEEPLMLVTGPRQGEMSEIVRLELLRDRDAKLVLLGAGSAINFILDGLQWCTVNKPARKKISLVYTTRDFDLFQWAMSAISNIVPVCEARGIFFDVKMAYTGSMTEDSSHNIESTMHSNDADYSMHGSMHGTMHGSMHESTYLTSSSEHGMNASTHSTRSIKSRSKSVSTQPNRFDLYGEIEAKSTVFCQGGAGLKNAVETVCKKAGARFYGGRGGAREDLS